MSRTRATVDLSTWVGSLGATPGGARVPLEVPARIGPVELIKQVGEGGMGVVWRARHEVLARDVAVKFLLSPLAFGGGSATGAAGDAAEVFVQGARAAAAVRHAGLTAVHDAGVVGVGGGGGGGGGVPYIIMEFVDGPSLADVLRRGPLSMGAARAILAQVCAAVAALHEAELVHRDIKPSNIMVNRGGTVLVTDFGLACPRIPRGGSGAAETVGGVSGTPGYMAPEMYEGAVTVRTDVYALGATALELLTGVGPRGTVAELRDAAERGVDVRSLLAGCAVPEGVVRVIERCMNKEAVYRPRGAGRVGELLEEAFEQALPAVRAATADAVREIAFPTAAAQAEVKKEGEPERGPVARTMAGLVSTLAELKRKSDPRLTAPAPAAGPLEASAPASAAEPPPVVKCVCGYLLAGVRGDRCPECGRTLGRASATRAAPVSAGAGSVGAPVRRAGLAPVPWRMMGLFALAGGVLLALMIGLLDRIFGGPTKLVYHIADWLDLWAPGHAQQGVNSEGIPWGVPVYLLGPVGDAYFILPLAVVGTVVFLAYRRIAFRSRGAGMGVACGWCGYDLAGIESGRCPECGRGMNERGGRSDRPPARQWWVRVRVAAISMVGLVLAGMVTFFVVGVSVHFLMPQDWQNQDTQHPIVWVMVGWGTFCGGLLAYHLSARRTAMLGGVARCGRCGASGEKLKGGRCLVCEPEAGEMARQEPAVRRASGVSSPICWRALLLCAGVGSGALTAVAAGQQVLNLGPLFLASRLAEWMGVLRKGLGPVFADGVQFAGVPPWYLEWGMMAVVGFGPPMVAVVATLVVYHRAAFSGKGGRPGLVCGWCGYSVAGIRGERCPECGRGFADRGKRGDRPPSRRWWPRLCAGWLALGALAATWLVLLLATRPAFGAIGFSRMSMAAQAPLVWVCMVLPVFASGLVAYHLGVRPFVMRDGVVRCGACGGEVGSAADGKCGRCGAGFGCEEK